MISLAIFAEVASINTRTKFLGASYQTPASECLQLKALRLDNLKPLLAPHAQTMKPSDHCHVFFPYDVVYFWEPRSIVTPGELPGFQLLSKLSVCSWERAPWRPLIQCVSCERTSRSVCLFCNLREASPNRSPTSTTSREVLICQTDRTLKRNDDEDIIPLECNETLLTLSRRTN